MTCSLVCYRSVHVCHAENQDLFSHMEGADGLLAALVVKGISE